MLSKRLQLHEELCEVLGNRNAYFQPPENLNIKYPCIVYSRRPDRIRHANDDPYIKHEQYDLTVITTDPDSTIADDLVSHFKHCRVDRYFVSDRLNHTTLNLFY